MFCKYGYLVHMIRNNLVQKIADYENYDFKHFWHICFH